MYNRQNRDKDLIYLNKLYSFPEIKQCSKAKTLGQAAKVMSFVESKELKSSLKYGFVIVDGSTGHTAGTKILEVIMDD